jgi:hypothetical protein
MELGGNEANQAKADPKNDRGNNLTINYSEADASPNYLRYELTCSTIETLSVSVNFMKFSTIYCGGRDTLANQSGYERR